MNPFAVTVLEISTVLQNIYFEEYVSVAAQSCQLVKKFILRESEGVIIISSTFSVNFSVNQFKLFSLYFFCFFASYFDNFNLPSCSRFLWVIPNSDLHNHANFEEVVNYHHVFQQLSINNFRNVSRINERFRTELFVTKVQLLISC